MKIVVAGGAGFLGSHLVDVLINQGHEVIAVDNCYTGSKLNLQQHFGNPNFEFMRHDVTIPLFVECDFIFNLASPASPIQYQKHPVQTIKTNILGSINLLGLAKRTGAGILQASTSEIYGDPLRSPQVETDWGNVNPIGIRACYDEGKRAAETLFFDYNRQYGVDIKVARIFNTYGPRMDLHDGRVVSNFIFQALNNQPLTIYGDGNQTRSFCYVDDLILGLLKLSQTDPGITGPINIGNPNEFSVLELANKIISLCESKSEIHFLSLPLDDPKQRKPDITRAQKTLSWNPRIDILEGLDLTIDDFRNRVMK
jgi:UDP-glucuronate decarboxylase